MSTIEQKSAITDFNWATQTHSLSPILDYIQVEPTPLQAVNVKILAEDMRDGLHGVNKIPKPMQMLRYVSCLAELGINQMTVGVYSGDQNNVEKTMSDVLSGIYEVHPDVTPVVLVQATEAAMRWLARCRVANPRVNAIVFMGTAPSRLIAEDWTEKQVLDKLTWAVHEASYNLGVPVIGATEHTTQTPPDFLRDIITAQVENGASMFCIADTIGIARPKSAFRLVKYVRRILSELGKPDMVVDWHGHRDLGNEIGNAMAAVAAGANRIHTVARGVGERAGNTPMETVMINLSNIILEGNLEVPWNLGLLAESLKTYTTMVGIPEPEHGVMARRSATTSLGIHGGPDYKLLIKEMSAIAQGDMDGAKKYRSLRRRVYSALDAEMVGMTKSFRVGPWSGQYIVQLAAAELGIRLDSLHPDTINHVLKGAKALGRELTNEELKNLIENY